MTWPATADVERFDEAVDWFRSRFPVTEELLDELGDYAGPRAWTVAGVAQLDVVFMVYAALLDAIATGTPLDEFRRRVREQLRDAWGQDDPHRIETIFRTNVQTAYNRGRWQQLQDDTIRRLRPYLMFDAVLDSRTSDICKPLDGTVLPNDDAFWLTHLPPLHHRCRSSLRSLRRAEAERRGISEAAPDVPAADGFGAVEAVFEPRLERYPDELRDEYSRKQRALTQDDIEP